MLPATTTKRGSRAWFEGKLNSIEAAGGEDARALASDKWAQIVWKNPHEAAFKPRPIGGIHCHAPKPLSLGIVEKQPRHDTGALVGALQDRIKAPGWWEGIDMTKSPSLTSFNETRKKTGKAIYCD